MTQNAARVVEVLETLRQRLRELIQSSENDFVAIGDTLQQLAGQTREISGRAESMAELMQGDDFPRAMEDLQSVLQQVGEAEQAIAGSRQILCSMIDHIAQTRRPLLGFGNLVRVLKILGLYTRIENARLGSVEADLSGVADDVRQLATEIEEKSDAILDQAQGLTAVLRTTIGSLDEQIKARKGDVVVLTQDAAGSLRTLAACHQRGTTAAARMSQHYAEVHRGISQLVTSMQFQEITRQQTEHICEAFQEIAGRLGSPGPSREDVHFAVNSSRLQAAQLRHTRSALVTAVASILESLHAVAGQTAAISTDTREMVRATDSQGNSVLDEVESRLREVGSKFGQYDESSQRLSQTVRSAISGINHMAEFANQIENTGFAMNIVALNAQIKTSHIGSEGAALGVLAGKIQEITGDTPQWIGPVASHLRSLSEGAKGLTAHVAGDEGSSSDVLRRELLACTSRIAGIRRQIEEQWGMIDAASRALGNDLEEAASRIDIHRRAEQVFDAALRQLEEVISMIAPEGGLGCDAETVARHEVRYTMEAERAVHGAAAGGASGEIPPAAVELPDKSGDDLGDNVELF
ncbi:MAG TPA: hypothetical protein VG672_01640, partial [Bryobacteraceae bacterium]|nr:hypothetical protein [Bryobacteraceae bacterium]